MNIKKLIIVTMFVVGLTPNNIRTACTSCNENDESGWQVINEQEEQEAAEPLISFVQKHRPQNQCTPLPYYQSHPSNVSFHRQTEPCDLEDPYAPCDADFQAREMEDQELSEEDQPYIVIYKTK
jgi:hypothetical protein